MRARIKSREWFEENMVEQEIDAVWISSNMLSFCGTEFDFDEEKKDYDSIMQFDWLWPMSAIEFVDEDEPKTVTVDGVTYELTPFDEDYAFKYIRGLGDENDMIYCNACLCKGYLRNLEIEVKGSLTIFRHENVSNPIAYIKNNVFGFADGVNKGTINVFVAHPTDAKKKFVPFPVSFIIKTPEEAMLLWTLFNISTTSQKGFLSRNNDMNDDGKIEKPGYFPNMICDIGKLEDEQFRIDGRYGITYLSQQYKKFNK